MIYMLLFWMIILLLIMFVVLNKITRWRGNFSGVIDFLVVFQALLLILALLTHDPLFTSLGVEPWWELTVGVLAGGFALWKAYFDPLKKKVYSLDREMGEVKSDISSMKIDIASIKNKIECLPRLEADMAFIKEKIVSR
ncbi:hypothetical protein HZA99_03555 [Candidatus Woesearchaeota archaeon]|nr:hypothetical protein [Candidatus Woesearchaeota archaeon]